LLSVFWCSDLSLPLCPSECECPLVGWLLSFTVLICPSIYNLQGVSAPYLLAFFHCPDLSLPLYSPESQCPSLVHFLSLF